MSVQTIINDNMSLEEKLAAIDNAMEQAVANAGTVSGGAVDPAELNMCIGCQ